MVGNFPAVFNFNRLFLKLNRFICDQLPVLPDHSCGFILSGKIDRWMDILCTSVQEKLTFLRVGCVYLRGDLSISTVISEDTHVKHILVYFSSYIPYYSLYIYRERDDDTSYVRATAHMRLRACDLCPSSTLIGGKGGASPSSLHTTLRAQWSEYVNAIWM